MQKALKEDEELVVLCSSAGETIRVLEFFVPSWNVLVLTGIDTEKNITRIITPVESLQLVCKSIGGCAAAGQGCQGWFHQPQAQTGMRAGLSERRLP